MGIKYCLACAFNNIIRRKKQAITNIIIMFIALVLLLMSLSFSKAIQNYIDRYITNTTLHRTLLSLPIVSENIDKERLAYEILSEDSRVTDVNEFVQSTLLRVINVDEVFGRNLPIEGGKICLDAQAYNKDIYKDIVAGRGILDKDKNVVVIPKYFYPDYSNEIDFFQNGVEYLNGEDYIGKKCTLEYESYDFDKSRYRVNGKYKYTFDIIGVYDNASTLDSSYGIYLPRSDLANIWDTVVKNSTGNTSTPVKQIYVVVDKQSNIDPVIDKLKGYGIEFERQATPGMIQEIGNYILLVGIISSFFVFIISIVFLFFSSIDRIRRRAGEIGILKAMGYTDRNIKSIMAAEGVIIGGLSIFLALLVTLVSIFIFNHIIEIKASFYFKGMRLSVDALWILLSSLFSLLLPCIVHLLAVKRIYKKNVIDIFRMQK